MNLVVKIVIALVIAAIAATAVQALGLAGAALYAVFAAVAVLVALLPSPARSTGPAATTGAASERGAARVGQQTRPGSADGNREFGKVKWFNVSKGFGFITKDDGEEIFVHFRSIRGSGRRGLRDGQRVSFVVAQSEKGPQAEDVEGLD